MERRALIGSLKIDRRVGLPTVQYRYFGALFLIIASIFLIWIFARGPSPVSIGVAYARPAIDGRASGAALLEASGYVVARREATVSSKITGRVTQLLIEEGQQVVAGQVIARLDASNALSALDQATAEIGAADAGVTLARVTEASSRSKFVRMEALSRSGWISKQSLDDGRAAYEGAQSNTELMKRQVAVARAAGRVLEQSVDDTIVRAPFSGVVTVKAAQVGEIVSPISAGGGFTRTGICTIVDMHSLEVEVDVAESYIDRVVGGMPASVRLNAYPDWEIPAEVAAVVPTGDRSKSTIKVRIRLKVEDPRIIPEMGGKVSFLNSTVAPSQPAAGSVAIPVDAVLPSSGGQYRVFVIGTDLRLEDRVVRVGEKRGDNWIVLAGLRAGERVALKRGAELRANMRVRLNDER